MSTIWGFPTVLNDTTLAVSSCDLLLEPREEGALVSSIGEGSKSVRDSVSSKSEKEASSSLDKYSSWGSATSSCCFSSGVDLPKLFSSSVTLSSRLEVRLTLRCGSSGTLLSLDRPRRSIDPSISLFTNSSSSSSKSSNRRSLSCLTTS